MKWKLVAVTAAAGIALACAGFWAGRASAGTADPGSPADPLVSKSYVDSMVAFQVVNVPAGQMIVGEGGTEIILRAGQATAVASAQGGIFDGTGGLDLAAGAQVKINHLLVVPRTDGRGLVAKTDIVLMVKGVYSLKPPGQ